MCKYEMDLASIVEVTERTQFCPLTDGQTDGRRETSTPPINFVEAEVIINTPANNFTFPECSPQTIKTVPM